MSEYEDKSQDEETEIVAKQISDGDPLAVSDKDSENQNVKDLESDLEDPENNSEKDLEDIQKESEKGLESTEKTLETDLEGLGEESEKDLEEAEKPLEDQLGSTEESDQGNSENLKEEEKVTTVVSTVDPLEEEEDPEPNEPEDPIVSDEYRKWISKMSVDIINYVDELKTQVCVAFGGGFASDYATSSFVKNSLITSAKELASQKDMKPPSPMQMFLMSLGAMTAPPVMLILFRKYIKPAPTNLNREKAEASDQPEAQTDYKNIIEYEQGRDQFKVHASGAYMYGLGGREDYVSATIADAYPSAEVQKLLDEGKNSAEIKKVIYG
jgi:hypothetical protein